ncbi:MAG: hypothetical protein GX153_03170 [Clostridiaceae bacterium]|nr:hypothetical protein [Clostridiaceae bacterium]
MPGTIFHLYVAQRFAERNPAVPASPDYYLGHVAPDAVLLRSDADAGLHAVTHLKQDGIPWERSVLESLRRLDHPSVYLLAFHLHVLVDVVFYEQLHTRRNGASAYGSAMEVLDRNLSARMTDLPAIVALMAKAKPADPTPGTTNDDLAAMVADCRRLVAEAPGRAEEPPDPVEYPLHRLLALTDPIVTYLENCLH